jgi:hypothetical protein
MNSQKQVSTQVQNSNIATSTPKPKYNVPIITFRTPDAETFAQVSRMSIVEDKPIMLDYWENSLEGTVVIGVKDNGEKLLVKDEEQYTSPIIQYFRTTRNDIVVMTENSIYIVDGKISGKKISS